MAVRMALHNWPEADEDGDTVKGRASALMRRGPCLRLRLRGPYGKQVDGLGLIDTGASATTVHQAAFQQVDSHPVDTAPVFLPSGERRFPLFFAEIEFLDVDIPPRRHHRVFGAPHIGKTPDGVTLLALLGRDFLRTGTFFYNGATGRWSLSWEVSEHERAHRG